MTDQLLMQFYNFDQSELTANRNGYLSEKQKTRLAKEENKSKGCSTFSAIFLFLIGLVGIIIGFFAGSAIIPQDMTAGVIVGGVFGCIWPLIWGGIGLIFLLRAFKKVEVQVMQTEGPINIVRGRRSSYNSETNTTSYYTVHELHVGGCTFLVNPKLADVLMQGDIYSVYYAHFNLDSKEDEILSLEYHGNAR